MFSFLFPKKLLKQGSRSLLYSKSFEFRKHFRFLILTDFVINSILVSF